ncbi:uncharacterized protein B0H64DRAFT_409240 [Chaetomium fimeti]|uniref:Uncharacterized protein n=1 Tax=Chaetomium fimeti TaxID=1854472 RepID=A0AAE0H8A0_9PEZI|nr:hypothetical protein B0H64DRAFT_409240 [Chaetomium fimeti]
MRGRCEANNVVFSALGHIALLLWSVDQGGRSACFCLLLLRMVYLLVVHTYTDSKRVGADSAEDLGKQLC